MTEKTQLHCAAAYIARATAAIGACGRASLAYTFICIYIYNVINRKRGWTRETRSDRIRIRNSLLLKSPDARAALIYIRCVCACKSRALPLYFSYMYAYVCVFDIYIHSHTHRAPAARD